jgi:hypothetical protein
LLDQAGGQAQSLGNLCFGVLACLAFARHHPCCNRFPMLNTLIFCSQ